MTEQTTITATSPWATYTATASSDLTCDEFIRYCAHLAKAQGYMLSNIADALETVHAEVEEELDMYARGRVRPRNTMGNDDLPF